jgi:DNA-binding FadR family transcriptional regulator
VRPRTGTRRLEYTFTPAVRQSLSYALSLDSGHFRKYSELRNHVESAFWYEAVAKLTDTDRRDLQDLITRAFDKLNGEPIQTPHEEHRQMHLLIYRRLENPFVTGLLEAYWDAYEAVGLNMFRGGYEYLLEVWNFHRDMVEGICSGNYAAGYDALVRHIDLLYKRPE